MPITDGVLTITPADISIKKHFFDAFGKMETEVSARWLIDFAQVRGKGWEPFTEEEINAFYHQKYPQGTFWFNGLTDKLIRKAQVGHEEGTVYYFTEEFIARCYSAATRP